MDLGAKRVHASADQKTRKVQTWRSEGTRFPSTAHSILIINLIASPDHGIPSSTPTAFDFFPPQSRAELSLLSETKESWHDLKL